MDSTSKKALIVGATMCACAATAYGVYHWSLNKDAQQEERDPMEELKRSVREPRRRVTLRYTELRLDIENRVKQVDTFMKDINNKEFPNPMVVKNREEIRSGTFLTSKSCIPIQAFTVPGDTFESEAQLLGAPRYKKAGPRTHLYYNPKNVKAAIVTCGGICPGVNVVIREIVMMLWYGYKVREIYGVKYGFKGFWAKTASESCYVRLVPGIAENEQVHGANIIPVADLHTLGGTVLGTSRGEFDAEKIVEELQARGINQVYAIGGAGTHKGLLVLSKLLKKKKTEISLIGVPKTIDNDIQIIDRTFGFDTAVEIAMWAIHCADVEANSAEYGVGLVKVMGRYAGHIAMHAALANRDVNICLIPESPFDVYGEKGLFEYIMKRLKERHHCVIVMSEGVGAAVRDVVLKKSKAKDASGNLIPPVGSWLASRISRDFCRRR
eukprot:TRINITY_DN9636_c0_g1_i15.p1 TRINITY_DN9636_c0_g1~~TRINITY_DN9636_c0_g1_i15.p1  ORF type:complete len:439 (+),score=98.41 TRINITY_DN9636_c0_g1_i15:181-1497(+)